MDVALFVGGLTFWAVSMIAAFGLGIWYSIRLRHAEQDFLAKQRERRMEFIQKGEVVRARARADMKPRLPRNPYLTDPRANEFDEIELDGEAIGEEELMTQHIES